MAIDHVLTPTQLEVLNHLLEGPTVSRAARSRRSTAPPSMFGSRRKTRRSALSMNAPTPSSPPPPPTASVSSTSRRLTPSKNRSAVPIPRPPSAFAPPSMCWAAAPDDPTQTGTRRAVVLSAAPRVSEPWYEADDGPSLRYTMPYIRPISARSGERPLAVISMPPPTSCTLPTSISSPSVGAGPLFAFVLRHKGFWASDLARRRNRGKNRVERKRNEAFITRSGICSRKKIGRFKTVLRELSAQTSQNGTYHCPTTPV